MGHMSDILGQGRIQFPSPSLADFPQAFHASQFATYHNAADVAVTFGSSRAVVDQSTRLPTGIVIEWFASILMSPVLAKQLRDTLSNVIDDYEKQFGVIPVDPAFSPIQKDQIPKAQT